LLLELLPLLLLVMLQLLHCWLSLPLAPNMATVLLLLHAWH